MASNAPPAHAGHGCAQAPAPRLETKAPRTTTNLKECLRRAAPTAPNTAPCSAGALLCMHGITRCNPAQEQRPDRAGHPGPQDMFSPAACSRQSRRQVQKPGGTILAQAGHRHAFQYRRAHPLQYRRTASPLNVLSRHLTSAACSAAICTHPAAGNPQRLQGGHAAASPTGTTASSQTALYGKRAAFVQGAHARRPRCRAHSRCTHRGRARPRRTPRTHFCPRRNGARVSGAGRARARAHTWHAGSEHALRNAISARSWSSLARLAANPARSSPQRYTRKKGSRSTPRSRATKSVSAASAPFTCTARRGAAVSRRRAARRQRRRARGAASAVGRRPRAGPHRCREATLPSGRQPADPTLPYWSIAGPRTDRKVTSGLLRASFFSPGYSRRQPGHQGTQKSATSRRWPATAARYAAGLAAGSRFSGRSPSHLVRSRLQRQPGLAARGGASGPRGRPRKVCF